MAAEVVHLRQLCASKLESGEKRNVSRSSYCLLDDADKIRLVRFMTMDSLHEHELLAMEACKAFIMDRETSCSSASTSPSFSTLFSMKECIATMIALPRGTRSSNGNAETSQWEQLRDIVDEQERIAKKLNDDLRYLVQRHVVGKANVIPPIAQHGKCITLSILSQCFSRAVPAITEATLSLQEFLRVPALNEEEDEESGRGGGGGGGGGGKTKKNKKMKHATVDESSGGECESSLLSISALVKRLGQYCLSFVSSSKTCASSFSAACVMCSHLLLKIGNEAHDILHGIVFALLELVEEEKVELEAVQREDFFRAYFPRACFVATVCERLISSPLISTDAFMLDNVLELFGWLVGSLLCTCELNDEATNVGQSCCIAHLQSTLSSLFSQSNYALVVHLTRHLAANFKSQMIDTDDGMRGGGLSKKCFEPLSSKSPQERVETFQFAIDKVFPSEDQDLVSSLVAVSPNPRLLLHSYGLVCCLRNSFSMGHDSYFGLDCCSSDGGSNGGEGDGRKKDGLYDSLITVQAMHELYRIFPVLFIRILVDAIAQVVSKKQGDLQANDLVDVEALMRLLDGITNSFCINVFDLLCCSLPCVAWRPKDLILSARSALLAPSSGSFASIIFLRYLSNQLFSSQLASWLITFGSQKPFACLDFLSLCHMLATNPSTSENDKGRNLIEKEKLRILLSRFGRTLTSSVEAAHASFTTICSVAIIMSESLASQSSSSHANSPSSSSPIPAIAASSLLSSYSETPSQLQPDDVPSALFVVEGLEHKLVSDFICKREAAVIDFLQGAKGAVKANCSWYVTQVINRLVCSLDGQINNSDLKRVVQNLIAKRDCFTTLVQQQQKGHSLGARSDGNLAVFCPLEKSLYARGSDQQRSRSSSYTILLAAISLPMFENLLTAGSGSTLLDASEIQASLYHRGLLCCDWISLTFTTIHALYNILCHKQQQMRTRVPLSFSGSSIYLDEGFVKAIHGHRGNFILSAIASSLQFHLTTLAMQTQSCMNIVVNSSASHFSYVLACIELVGACGDVRMISSLAIMVTDKCTLAACINALILGNDLDRLDEARAHAQAHLKAVISHFILVFVSTFEKTSSFVVDEQVTLANALPLFSLGTLILSTGSVDDGLRQSLTDTLAQIGSFISRSACVTKWLEESELNSARKEEGFLACKLREEAFELIVMCESTPSLRPIRMTFFGTGIRPGRSTHVACEQLEGALASPDLFLPFERQAALQVVVLPSFEFLWESLLTSSPSNLSSFQSQDLVETTSEKGRVEASPLKAWAQDDAFTTQQEAEDFTLQALLQHLCDAFYVPIEFQGKTASAQLALLDTFLSSLCWKRNDNTSLLVSRLATWHLSSPRNCADVCSSSPFWVLNRIGTFVRNTVLVRCHHSHELQEDVVGSNLLAAFKILDIVPPRGVIAWRQSASRGGGEEAGQIKMEVQDGFSMLTDEDLCSKAMQDVATLLEAASRFKNESGGVSKSVWQVLLYYLIGTVFASYSTQHKQLLEEHCRAQMSTDEEEDDIEVTSISTLLHNLSVSLVHLSSTKRGRDEKKPVEATFLHNLRWACTHCKYLSVFEPISRLQMRLHNLGYRDMIVAEAFNAAAISSPLNFNEDGGATKVNNVDSSKGRGGGGGGGGGGGDVKLSPNEGASPRILQSKRSPLKALIEKRGLEYGHEDSHIFVASPNKRRRGEEEVGIEASLRAEAAVEEDSVQGSDSLIPEVIDFESAVVAIKATSESVKNEEGWTMSVEKEEIAKKWGSSF